MINFFNINTISVYGFMLFNFIDVSAKNAFETEYICVNNWKLCYKNFSRKNWDDANAQCESDGTHLAVVHSQTDNARLYLAM